MLPIDSPNLGIQKNTSLPSIPKEIDTKAAKAALHLATEKSEECHLALGILHPDETTTEINLGKNENYGSHRVGSVTKTFTTFLALKLIKDGMITLDKKCGEVIDKDVLKLVFQNPDWAAEMTLDQLLSHTAGMELDDHNRQKPEEGLNQIKTMHDRFMYECTVGERQYIHTHRPGDGIGSYSNAGLAIAAWMLETAYNAKSKEKLPFSQIMKKEIFEGIFQLTDDTRITPGLSGDIIGSGAGDMSSSIHDLLKVAKKLQQDAIDLDKHFGQGWQKTMLKPRDLFKQHGLGCEANATSLKHPGLNAEIIDEKLYTVTAVVIFPLGKGEPALVAMSDSDALGPKPIQQDFIKELEKLAGISTKEESKPPNYDLNFFCPEPKSDCVFKGNAYIVTDSDPFSSPQTINLSRNGMKHKLHRDPKFDNDDAVAYEDTNGNKWIMISKGEKEERKMIYSNYCLVSPSPEIRNLEQPPLETLKKIKGEYFDAFDEVTYKFEERGGHLYFSEGGNETYPALYLPEENCWVVSLPEGRKDIKFRFPEDESEPLIVLEISKTMKNSSPILEKDYLRPLNCRKVKDL